MPQAVGQSLVEPESGLSLEVIVDGKALDVFTGAPEQRFAHEGGLWNYMPIVGKHRFSRYSLRVKSTVPRTGRRYFAKCYVDGQSMFTTYVTNSDGTLECTKRGKEERGKLWPFEFNLPPMEDHNNADDNCDEYEVGSL